MLANYADALPKDARPRRGLALVGQRVRELEHVVLVALGLGLEQRAAARPRSIQATIRSCLDDVDAVHVLAAKWATKRQGLALPVVIAHSSELAV